MLDDSITVRKIKERHVNTDNNPGEPEYDSVNVQLNVIQQVHGEKSITDDGENVTKNCDQDTTKAGEILKNQKQL